MRSRPKLLILDDDQDFLEVCHQMLSALPSQPEVFTANSGSRALALLESEPFSLLLTDLRMPKMDGFQVLAIVRRRLPSLRIVVMTGAVDEHARARGYALGIDLFVEKPKSPKERQLFIECVESMLERDAQAGGFRGVVQSKALVDIVQLECLTQSSAVLKISSGKSVGYVWFQNGEIIDAATATAKAEEAFKEILSWKVGSFDLLPPEPLRTRSIFTSSQGLLLDMAQSLDEAGAAEIAAAEAEAQKEGAGATLSRLSQLGRIRGVEFLLSQERSGPADHWSCENPAGVAGWAQRLLAEYRALGETLKVNGPSRIEGYGSQRHVAVLPLETGFLTVGFDRALRPEQARNALEQVLNQWES